MVLNFSHLRKLAINRVSAHLTENGLEHKILRKEIMVPVIRGKNYEVLNGLQSQLHGRGLGSKVKHHALQYLLAEQYHPHVLVGLIPHGYKRDGNFEVATSVRIVFYPVMRKARSKK